jgi:Ran GTPase-activating protein (RanGAP) involved in mRNA processing and transport
MSIKDKKDIKEFRDLKRVNKNFYQSVNQYLQKFFSNDTRCVYNLWKSIKNPWSNNFCNRVPLSYIFKDHIKAFQTERSKDFLFGIKAENLKELKSIFSCKNEVNQTLVNSIKSDEGRKEENNYDDSAEEAELLDIYYGNSYFDIPPNLTRDILKEYEKSEMKIKSPFISLYSNSMIDFLNIFEDNDLKNNSSIKILRLTINWEDLNKEIFSSKQINLRTDTIKNFFENNKSIQILDLSFKDIRELEFESLMKFLKNYPALKRLSLYVNDFTYNKSVAIGNMLKKNTTLQSLDISCIIPGGNMDYSKNFSVIAKSLQNNTTLTELNVSNNYIDNYDVRILMESIKKSPTLKKLDISKNDLKSDGLLYLSNIIFQGFSLKSLDISDNDVGNKYIENLLKALKEHKIIIDLNLSNNHINDDSVENITNFLKKDNSLKELYLQKNNITEKGILSIVTEAVNSNGLKYLNLKKNSMILSEEIKLKIHQLKKQHNSPLIIDY